MLRKTEATIHLRCCEKDFDICKGYCNFPCVTSLQVCSVYLCKTVMVLSNISKVAMVPPSLEGGIQSWWHFASHLHSRWTFFNNSARHQAVESQDSSSELFHVIQEGSSVATAEHLSVLEQQSFLLFAYDKLSLMAASCLALVKIHLSPTWKMKPGRKEWQKHRKTELSQEITKTDYSNRLCRQQWVI